MKFGNRQGRSNLALAGLWALAIVLLAGCGTLRPDEGGRSSQKETAAQKQSPGASQGAKNGGMKPFSDVVPDTARTDEGLITTHRAGDDLYLGIPTP
jgi:hypothetical protein